MVIVVQLLYKYYTIGGGFDASGPLGAGSRAGPGTRASRTAPGGSSGPGIPFQGG